MTRLLHEDRGAIVTFAKTAAHTITANDDDNDDDVQ